MSGKSTLLLQVDWENNSEAFWEWFSARFPYAWGKELFFVSPEVFKEITEAPGWNDPEAPDYAPHPLVEVAIEDVEYFPISLF